MSNSRIVDAIVLGVVVGLGIFAYYVIVGDIRGQTILVSIVSGILSMCIALVIFYTIERIKWH